MSTHNLDKVFAPHNVAVIGASQRVGSVGQSVMRNLVQGGFKGKIYPVNPKYTSVDRWPCYSRVGDLPESVDLAVICTPASTVPPLVRECGKRGIYGLVILSAGFREASAEGSGWEAEIGAIAREYQGLRIIGPNCLGVISPHSSLNASFAGDSPPKGHVAFISQSGALCTAILDWAIQENVGFSQFVSVGNMLDVGIADLIDYFASDHHTDAIILYVEAITNARAFLSAARAFTRTKPIVIYKAGRFAESARAVASHTGAMAGVDSVYDAAFARVGMVRVFEIEELFDCAELLARYPKPCGPRLAIVTNAGGPGVMATDALMDSHGRLATLTSETIEKLDKHLPANWSRCNPVDILGDATPTRFVVAVETVLQDKEVDAVVVILSPQAMTDPINAAKLIIDVVKHSPKPVLTSWMGGKRISAGVELLSHAGIPTYTTPEKCIHAFMHLLRYARNRETLYETPRELPLAFSLDRDQRRKRFDSITGSLQNTLSEYESKALFEAFDLTVSKTEIAKSKDEAIAISSRLGFPVVLKIFSPDIPHKTDVDGVELNVMNAVAVGRAFEAMIKRVQERQPTANIDGVTIQPMISVPLSRELIIGAKRDPVFGPVMLVGAGGITAELYHDIALEIPPLNERLARRMLESLQLWPLLCGYRSRKGVNLDRLIEVMIRVSVLVAEFPEIAELDINPLLATPQDAIALDARIVLDRERAKGVKRPYDDLAIRPYPDEFVKHTKLKDGTPVLLRPIKPEDEPMWHELIAACSRETIHQRFHYLFKTTTHEMASRFCFVDYDRELAIVAEVDAGSKKKLIGVGRLVADANHEVAEYAALVVTGWQGIGLGSLITDECLGICDSWGVKRVVAEVAHSNYRMLRMFSHRGFEADHAISPDVVVVSREVGSQSSESMAEQCF